MKKVFPYYDLPASIRLGDKPWPEYPHVYLANMEISQDSIRAFTNLYGRLFEDYEPTWSLPEAPVRTQDAVIRKGRKPMDVRMVKAAQRVLRESWGDSPEYLKALRGHDPDQDAFLYAPMQPQISVTNTGLELIAPDAWTFARLAFLCDHAAGKTKICANPDCKSSENTTRYFVQSKRGQLFCCHRCAVLVNVRRFRQEREAPTKPKINSRATSKRHKK